MKTDLLLLLDTSLNSLVILPDRMIKSNVIRSLRVDVIISCCMFNSQLVNLVVEKIKFFFKPLNLVLCYRWSFCQMNFFLSCLYRLNVMKYMNEINGGCLSCHGITLFYTNFNFWVTKVSSVVLVQNGIRDRAKNSY